MTELPDDAEKIGKGGNAEIFKTSEMLSSTNGKIALKIVQLKNAEEVEETRSCFFFRKRSKIIKTPVKDTKTRRFSAEAIEKERKIWERLSNEKNIFILGLHGYEHHKTEYWFKMPLVEWSYLYKNQTIHTVTDFGHAFNKYHGFPLSMDIVKDIYAGAFIGLKVINELGYIHCDVKPENILLTEDFVPKIADFDITKKIPLPSDQDNISNTDLKAVYLDLSKYSSESEPFAFGTEIYAPPEAWLGQKYNITWDAYSLCMSMLVTKLDHSPWDVMSSLGSFQSGIGMIFIKTYIMYKDGKVGDLEDKEQNLYISAEEHLSDYYLKKCNVINKFVKRWPDSRENFADFAQEYMCFNIEEKMDKHGNKIPQRGSIAEACSHPYMADVVQRWESDTAKASSDLKGTIEEYVVKCNKDSKRIDNWPDYYEDWPSSDDESYDSDEN